MPHTFQGMRARLGRFGIKARLIAVSAVWFLGLGVVAASTYAGLDRMMLAEEEVKAAGGVADKARAVQASVAALIADERDFLLEPSAASAKAMAERHGEAVALVSAMRADPAIAGDAAVADLVTALERIGASIADLTALQERVGHDGASGLEGEVNAAFAAIRTEINKVSKSGQNPATARVVQAFAQMGQARAEFALTGDDLARGGFDAAASRLRRAVDGAEIPDDAKARIAAPLAAAETAFTAWAAAVGDRVRVVDQIGLAFDLVGPATRQIEAAAAARQTDAEAALTAAENRTVAVLAVTVPLTVAAGLGLSFAIARGITGPLGRLEGAMADLAEGRPVADIAGVDRGDEIGRMARAVAVFRTMSEERRRLEADGRAAALARTRRQEEIDAAIAAFKRDVASLTTAVAATMDEMNATAGTLSRTADESAGRAADASSASGTASRKVSLVAAAAEELAASIGEIGAQVARTTAIVADATERARRTNDTVTSLAEAAGRVGQVVTLIRGIAEQTNLLALNATIEAARAGAAGRGFAVVASEVKTLASQTAQATGDISAQISGIQASTTEAVAAIQSIAAIMEDVNHTTAAIAAAVEQQGAATGDISRNVQDAASETQVVTDNVASVSMALGETNETAAEVGRAAASVVDRTRDLDAAIGRFLAAVAA
ncbi:methyl-accepting chemotaxis protein [Chthonobacter rhizosphaerae]|uniref:methyl-accepting chemotaxis protein n=1 Tax=Chthonobacter rhizosphaerae TaxID=2735553 RepID=UPI0015EF8EFC|nr:methyl-accepting chemotaxis protein [Chthonobacter rhizosphaerae]